MDTTKKALDDLDKGEDAYGAALKRLEEIKEKGEYTIPLLKINLRETTNNLEKNAITRAIDTYDEELEEAKDETREAKRIMEAARRQAMPLVNTSLRKSLIDYSVDTWKITGIRGASKVWESPALPGVKITEKGSLREPPWTLLSDEARQNKIFQELKKMKGEILGKSGINTSGIGYKPVPRWADRENRGFGKNPYWLRTRGTTTFYGSTNPAQKKKDLKRLGEGNNRWDWLLNDGKNGEDDKSGLSTTVTKEDVRRLEKEYKEFYEKTGLAGLGYVTALPLVRKRTQQPIIINDYIDILAPQYLKRASVASGNVTEPIDLAAATAAVAATSAAAAASAKVAAATKEYNEARGKVDDKQKAIDRVQKRINDGTSKYTNQESINDYKIEIEPLKREAAAALAALKLAQAEEQAQAPKPASSLFGSKAAVAPAPSSKNWRETTERLSELQAEDERNEIQSLIRHLMFFRDSLTGNLDKTKLGVNIDLPNTGGISALKGKNFSIPVSENKNTRRKKSKANSLPLVYSFRIGDRHNTGLGESKLPIDIGRDKTYTGAYFYVAYPGYYNLFTVLSGHNTMIEILEAMLGYARKNYRSYYDDVLTAYLIATRQVGREEIEGRISSQLLNIYKERQGIKDDIDKRAQYAQEIQGRLDQSSLEATAQLMAQNSLKPILEQKEKEVRMAIEKKRKQDLSERVEEIKGVAHARLFVESVGGMNQGGGGGANSAMTAAFAGANLSGAVTVTKSGKPVSLSQLPAAAAAAAVTPAAAAAARNPALQSQVVATLTAALAGLSSPLSVASSIVPLTTPLAATPTSLTKRPRSAPLKRSAAASPLLLPPSVTPFTAASTPPAAPAAAPAAAAAENNSKRMAATANRLTIPVTTPRSLFTNLNDFTKLVKDTLDGRKENKMDLVKLIAGNLGNNILECITKFKEGLSEKKETSLYPSVEGLRGTLGMLRTERVKIKGVKDEVEAIQVLKDILKIMNDIMSIITNKKKGGARKTRRAQKTRRRRARKTRR